MKKTIIASALVLLSSGAIADDFFSSYEKKNSSIEISAINYSSDIKALDEDQIGARIRYQSRDSLSFGYQISHEGFNYDDDDYDITSQISTAGVTYQVDLFESGFYLKPEMGIYHVQAKDNNTGNDESDTNGYGKITFGGNLISNKLDAKLYYAYYNQDSDISNKSESNAFGGQLNYSFNRDFDLMFHIDEFEDSTMIGIGISIKYW